MHALADDVDSPGAREDKAHNGGGAKDKTGRKAPRYRRWPAYSAVQLYHLHEDPGETPSKTKKPAAKTENPADHVECERLHVRVIANCSDEVRQVALYPLLVFFLLLSIRLPAFDNAGLTWIVATLVVVLAVVGAACALRYTAGKARHTILARLRDGLASAAADNGTRNSEVQMERYERAIEETEKQRRGAFLPLTQDLWFQVLAIPFGGVGGLVLLEHFLGWW